MEVFGCIQLSAVMVSAVALRDVLLGTPVFWIAAPSYAVTFIAVTSLACFLTRSRFHVIFWLDAFALTLFSVFGAETRLSLVQRR